MPKRVKRLISQFNPSHYDIRIKIHSDKKSFSGHVRIVGQKVWRPNQRLVFHQNGLKITSATIKKLDKKEWVEYPVVRILAHKTLNEVRLHTDRTIYPGQYDVVMHFEADITDTMHGIYPCYYTDGEVQKSIIATQFESHYAREVFPCIDEPEAKATFQLTIETPIQDIVLANTPIEKQTADKEHNVTTFETTPKMSTYLLAFACGELHSVEASTKNNIVVKSWASKVQPLDSLEYANKQAVRILEFFSDYFDTPFPLKKLDQIALPDFEMGAMENWGLITYREIALLSDPKNASLTTEQYVSLVVAHEISHQWFGNLVTMKWWDDLWLNESFASIMEHVALNILEPSWHQWEQYVSTDIISTSSRDIFKDVQAVRTDVKSPDEISTLFDGAIVYAKGSRLLKMLIDYIGEDAFRAGLKAYFKQYAYTNTSRDDLWECISAASGKDIAALMNPWLEQSGMPVVTVVQDDASVTLSQSRFVLDMEDSPSIWPVPLFANISLSTDMLDKQSHTYQLDNKMPVLLNTYASGHYLTAYASSETKKYIADRFANNELAPETKISMLNDSLLLARRGDISITDALDMVQANKSEQRDAVWSMMCRIIGSSSLLTEEDEETRQKINLFKCSVANTPFKQLGWNEKPSEDANTRLLRILLIGLLVGGEDQKTVSHCLELYDKANGEVPALPADLRATILTAVVRHGHKDELPNLVNQYKSSHNPDVQFAICIGLTDIQNATAAEKLITEALGSEGFVRTQDIPRWFAYFMRNRHTRHLAWEWLTTDWERIVKTLNGTNLLDDIPTYAAMSLSTKDWQKKYNVFFTEHEDMISLKRNIAVAKSAIASRVAWQERDYDTILGWYRKL